MYIITWSQPTQLIQIHDGLDGYFRHGPKWHLILPLLQFYDGKIDFKIILDFLGTSPSNPTPHSHFWEVAQAHRSLPESPHVPRSTHVSTHEDVSTAAAAAKSHALSDPSVLRRSTCPTCQSWSVANFIQEVPHPRPHLGTTQLCSMLSFFRANGLDVLDKDESGRQAKVEVTWLTCCDDWGVLKPVKPNMFDWLLHGHILSLRLFKGMDCWPILSLIFLQTNIIICCHCEYWRLEYTYL